MELDAAPGHLLVLGGGYIGLEFGQMFRRFGSQVTIVQRRGQLLAREDPDVAEEMTKILRGEGITVLLDTRPIHVDHGDGEVRLRVQDTDGERTIVGSHLLAAAGRVSNSDRLHLAAAGVETDDRGLHPGERSARDQRAGHLCPGRRQRRPGLYPRLL